MYKNNVIGTKNERKTSGFGMRNICAGPEMHNGADFTDAQRLELSRDVEIIALQKIGFFCVAMLKKNKTEYLFNGAEKTLAQIYNAIKKRPGRAKYLASVNVTLAHKRVIPVAVQLIPA